METAERFARLFRGFKTRFGKFRIDGQSEKGKLTGKADTVNQPVSLSDYAKHLAKVEGVGIIPLTEDNKVYFAAIDIDVYPISHSEIAKRLEELPVIVTRSKSGGAHVWLFCEMGAPAQLARDVLKHWAAELGYGGCEIFPKQSERAGPTDVGNWINLPYFGDTRVAVSPVKRGDSIEIEDLPLEVFLSIAEQCAQHVTEDWLQNVAMEVRAQRDGTQSTEDWEDGPPCLQRLLVGNPKAKKEELRLPQITEGGRNTTFFNAAVYLFRKYGNVEIVREKLVAINLGLNLGLTITEIEVLVKQGAKDYGYQCQSPPLCNFCARSVCAKRRHGVGSKPKDLAVEISGMTIIETDPTTYAFNVDGKRVRMEGDSLLNQHRLRRLLLDATGRIFPPMREDAFYDLIQSYVDSGTRIEAPPETDSVSDLRALLAEFITTKKTTRPDRYHMGSVYWDENERWAYFKFQDFLGWLKQQRTTMTRNDVTFGLQALGCIHHAKGTSIDGKSVRPWAAPIKDFSAIEADDD